MLRGRLSSATGAIGVDFGANVVRMLQLRERPGDLSVVGAADVDLPAAASRADGEDAPSREENVDRIRRAARRGAFIGRRCTVSLPASCVHVQAIRLPSMSDADLRDAIRWEAVERFHLDRDACEVDFVRTGAVAPGSEKREEILAIAVAHDELLPRLQMLADAGLQPIAVDTHFSALARVFSRQCRRESDRDEVRAVLEVGETAATAIVLRGPTLAFCKPLGVSTRRLDQATAERLDIDISAAAALRDRRMLSTWNGVSTDVDRAADRAVFEAVRPQLDELVREFVLCLRYYGVTFRGRPPSCTFLAGPGAAEPCLDEMLASASKVPVYRDDTSDIVHELTREISARLGRDAVIGPGWEIAIGVGLRGLQSASARRVAA